MRYTGNYSFRQPERAQDKDDRADIEDLTYNWDTLDTLLQGLEDGGTEVKRALEAHANNFLNPHKVTPGQIGAYTKAEVDQRVDGYDTHLEDRDNPHETTADQVGAYTKETVNSLLDGKVDRGGELDENAVLVTNATGAAVTSILSVEELERLSGIESNVQQQLDYLLSILPYIYPRVTLPVTLAETAMPEQDTINAEVLPVIEKAWPKPSLFDGAIAEITTADKSASRVCFYFYLDGTTPSKEQGWQYLYSLSTLVPPAEGNAFGIVSSSPDISFTGGQGTVHHAEKADEAVRLINPNGNADIEANTVGITLDAGGNLRPYHKNKEGLNLGTETYKWKDGHFAGRIEADTFAGALEGNADTASKLNNPLTINGTTYDGSEAVNLTVVKRAAVGTGKNESHYWVRVATINNIEPGQNVQATFLIDQTYSGAEENNNQAILTVNVRRGTSDWQPSNSSLAFLVKSDRDVFENSYFKLVFPSVVLSSSQHPEIWQFVAGNNYTTYRWTVLSEGFITQNADTAIDFADTRVNKGTEAPTGEVVKDATGPTAEVPMENATGVLQITNGGTGNTSGKAASAEKVSNPLIINDIVYDGSQAQSLNLDDTYLKKTGDTMSGDLNMSGNLISNVDRIYGKTNESFTIAALGTTGGLIFNANSRNQLAIYDGVLRPTSTTAGAMDIGTNTYQVRNLFLSGNAFAPAAPTRDSHLVNKAYMDKLIDSIKLPFGNISFYSTQEDAWGKIADIQASSSNLRNIQFDLLCQWGRATQANKTDMGQAIVRVGIRTGAEGATDNASIVCKMGDNPFDNTCANLYMFSNNTSPASYSLWINSSTKPYGWMHVTQLSMFEPLTSGHSHSVSWYSANQVADQTYPTGTVVESVYSDSNEDYLPLAGGTMAGILNMGDSEITNVPKLISNTTNLILGEQGIDTFVVRKSSITPVAALSGAYDLGTSSWTWRNLYLSGNAIAPTAPTDDAHLTNKRYVDNSIAVAQAATDGSIAAQQATITTLQTKINALPTDTIATQKYVDETSKRATEGIIPKSAYIDTTVTLTGGASNYIATFDITYPSGYSMNNCHVAAVLIMIAGHTRQLVPDTNDVVLDGPGVPTTGGVYYIYDMSSSIIRIKIGTPPGGISGTQKVRVILNRYV